MLFFFTVSLSVSMFIFNNEANKRYQERTNYFHPLVTFGIKIEIIFHIHIGKVQIIPKSKYNFDCFYLNWGRLLRSLAKKDIFKITVTSKNVKSEQKKFQYLFFE